MKIYTKRDPNAVHEIDIIDTPLTNSRALISNGSGKIASSTVTSTELGYLGSVTSALQTQLNGKVSSTGDTMTGNLIIDKNSANIFLNTDTDGGNASITLRENGVSKGYFLYSPTTNQLRLLNNVSSKGFTLFDAGDAELNTNLFPATTQTYDLGSGAKEWKACFFSGNITNSGFTASRALVSNGSKVITSSAVTSTELGYVSGVTSNLQTQLGTLTTAVGLNTTHRGYTNNPHSTSKTHVGLSNVTNTSDANKPVSTAQQTALNLKEDSITTLTVAKGGTNSGTALINNRIIVSSGSAIVENAAITGSRALQSNASGIPEASAITSTELGYLDGVTSAIQTQFNSLPFELCMACSDETTDLTTGAAKLTFRMPFAATLTDVYAEVNTAPVGSTIIVDINESGATILSTKLTIDVNEEDSEDAAVPVVISDTSLAARAEMTIDIDQIGNATAGKGLKVWFVGTRA